jgi:hypothetical protein
MRRLATLLFRWSAWLAALACVPGGTLWALTPLGTHLADQRLPAGSDRFWQLFSTAPLLLLVGLAGLWWLGYLGSGRLARAGLVMTCVGLGMVVFGNIVPPQYRFRVVSYSSSHETSNLCMYAFGRGARTA